MTLLNINLTDVLSETDPDDRVIVWAPAFREGPAGRLVGPRRKSIPLVDGVGSDEVVPGPLMVQVQCKAMTDTSPREVVVPEEGPVTLTALFEQHYSYDPPAVNAAYQYSLNAAASASDAATSATNAASSSASANTSKNAAATSATNAADSATSAATSASAAAASEDDAEAAAAVAVAAAWSFDGFTPAQVSDAALRAEDAAVRAENAAGVAFTEDPAGSGLYTFPTTAGA